MTYIDPAIWNYAMRVAVRDYAGDAPYKINTFSGKVHSYADGKEKVESITKILASGNMRRKGDDKREGPFAPATFNPGF